MKKIYISGPMAHGVPGRMGQLRAYGNAIVPQCAAEFVAAFMECYPRTSEQKVLF